MKKMPCLFQRTFHDKRSFTLHPDVTPGCEWALAGEGTAHVKWDGTACMVRDGRLFKRYDAKRHPKTGEYKTPTLGAIPCDEPDAVTGHWPHWISVGDEPESKYHREAFKGRFEDGTYELCGPAINANRHRLVEHILINHNHHILVAAPRDFDDMREYLSELRYEGVVFHHPDGRMCKIRRADFGFAWPVAK